MHISWKTRVLCAIGLTVLLPGLALLWSCSGWVTKDIGAGANWPLAGGDINDTHYSRLEQINRDNLSRLGFAWEYDLGTERVQEATPVVIDGVMYHSGNLGRVYALDAVTGRALWTFTPQVDMQVNRAACCDQANRGLAVANGKVFVASLDGWLYALDAKHGSVVWKADTFVDRSRGYTITGAPEVAGDLVIIGNGGAEYDTRGYVTAYRISDGKQAWRFYTIPHDPAKGPQESKALEAAAKTWDPKSTWDIGGGGTVWDAINYDPRFGTVYIGVGNGGPYNFAARSPKGGDNLYLSSIVALDAGTGKMKWYYQETPEDAWDFTATQPMVLADLEIDGTRRPVIIHAPKNGFLFVIDRETGKPLAINALVRTTWTDGYDLKTGRAHLTPDRSAFWKGPKIVFPGSPGARNWYPPAFDPERNTYFAAVLDMGNLMVLQPGKVDYKRRKKALNIRTVLMFTPDLEKLLGTFPPAVRRKISALPEMKMVRELPFSSQIRAIDPMTGKSKWTVKTAGWQDRMGMLATRSGLLFHGSIDGTLYARDSDTGKVLLALQTGRSIMAAPMTYEVNGVQYVAVATGLGGGGWSFRPDYSAAFKYGNDNHILVFKLDGAKPKLPAPLPPTTVAPMAPPQLTGVTPATIANGQALFRTNCAICHSNQPRAGLPDLRRMPPEIHQLFDSIVLKGMLLGGGMPRWDDLLSTADAHAIHAYLIDEQTQLRVRELELKRQGKPLDATSSALMSNF